MHCGAFDNDYPVQEASRFLNSAVMKSLFD